MRLPFPALILIISLLDHDAVVASVGSERSNILCNVDKTVCKEYTIPDPGKEFAEFEAWWKQMSEKKPVKVIKRGERNYLQPCSYSFVHRNI